MTNPSSGQNTEGSASLGGGRMPPGEESLTIANAHALAVNGFMDTVEQVVRNVAKAERDAQANIFEQRMSILARKSEVDRVMKRLRVVEDKLNVGFRVPLHRRYDPSKYGDGE